MVRVCHECALKKGELINLSVRDVAKAHAIKSVMNVGGEKINLSGHAKRMLQNHIDYLHKSGYRLYPTSPLFPTKDQKRYNHRTLGNHLNEAQNVEI
jgi:hypothetical protein